MTSLQQMPRPHTSSIVITFPINSILTAVYALVAKISGRYFDTLDPTLLFSCNLAGFCGFCGSEHLSQRFWFKITTLDTCTEVVVVGGSFYLYSVIILFSRLFSKSWLIWVKHCSTARFWGGQCWVLWPIAKEAMALKTRVNRPVLRGLRSSWVFCPTQFWQRKLGFQVNAGIWVDDRCVRKCRLGYKEGADEFPAVERENV